LLPKTPKPLAIIIEKLMSDSHYQNSIFTSQQAQIKNQNEEQRSLFSTDHVAVDKGLMQANRSNA